MSMYVFEKRKGTEKPNTQRTEVTRLINKVFKSHFALCEQCSARVGINNKNNNNTETTTYCLFNVLENAFCDNTPAECAV